ncbi:MAG: flagellar M-ring protein FliF [candidate division Zixibacteria bacterium]|nr:flagellar M-ring protein FliF [candidate division Zixibacteria bacterium]
MEALSKYIEQFKEWFSEQDQNRKLLVIVGAAAVLGIIVVSSIWMFSKDYTYLYTNLDPVMAGKVTAELDNENIPYQVSNSGTAVMVADEALYDARIKLASKGLPNSKAVGFEIFDNTNLGMTDYVQKINYRRALEGELSKSIDELEFVNDTRVHLVIPEHRLFEKDQQPPTASILVNLKHEGALTKGQVRGVSHLVASSVEGMSAKNITIVDQFGNLLTPENAGSSVVMASSRQIELRSEVEKYLESKASNLLENVVGRNNAIVKVSLELDFDRVEKNIESYDPDATVIRSEERTTEEGTNLSGEPGGNSSSTIESSVTNYEVSKSMERIVKQSGSIKNLSVAVMVNGSYAPAENNEEADENGMKYIPRSQGELDQLGNIVKRAVGFRTDRGDQFQIESMQFDNSEEIIRQKELDVLKWQRWLSLFFYYAVRIAIIGVVFIIARRLLRRYQAYLQARREEQRRAKEEQDASELANEARKPKLIDKIKYAADENPEEMARVIRTIMTEE